MSVSKEQLNIDNRNQNLNQNNKSLIPLNDRNNNISRKSIELKKLKTLLSINDAKILNIKNKKHLSVFHLVNENDRYMQIENQIQKQILNISMRIIKDYKFDPDSNEFVPQQTKTKHKSIGNLELIDKNNHKIISNKNILSNRLRKNLKKNRRTNLEIFKAIIRERSRKIKRIENLYDSYGEDESDKEKEQSNYGLNPRSLFINIFDSLILFSSLFCLFYLPYRLAKTKMIINSNEYFVLIMLEFSEIIYFLDLLFGFFRWFYNNEFKLVNNGYMIIKNYLESNFVFDLIMSIPFYTIFRFQNNLDNEFKYNEKYFMLKIMICLKAFKIFKLKRVKANRVINFISRIFAKNYLFERIYQIYNFILIICAIFNLIICIHIYMAEKSYPNWIVSNNLEDKPFIEIYVASFYFIIATMTSVGYGDITCINFEETCFQIVLLSIGLVVYSWIISTVGDYVKNESRANINYNKDMSKLEEIRVAYPNMPFKLYHKIQQHIKRMLTQSKKYEYNILVNSLPYYLQNSVFFQIHKNEIDKFTFFKNCHNSDFILKVLTYFIPVYSKKNIVLVGEGEYFENMFFIKSGRLSMEAIIDLDNIEMSIAKYLKFRFEAIEQIEDLIEKKNTFDKSRIIDQSLGKTGISNTGYLMGMINKQFENVEDVSYLHESNIEQEIGKCNFDVDIKDLYKGKIQYLRILDLLKNEYFGEIFMLLNIPNPLSLKVKSKRVELYILRKKDANNIKNDYQNIWQRINKKSIHNIKSLKSLTLNIINRYCEMNGIEVREKEMIKLKPRKMSLNDWTKSINTTYFINRSTLKSIDRTKLDFSKSKRASIEIEPKNFNLKVYNNNKTKKIGIFNEKNSNKTKKKIKFNLDENFDKKEKKRKSNSVKYDKKRTRKINIRNTLSPFSSDLESEKTKNKELKSNINKILLSPKNKKIHKYIYNFQNSKKIENMRIKNLSNTKNIKEYMSDFTSLSGNYTEIKNRYSNKAQVNSNSNNHFVISRISNINDLNSINSNFNNHITKEITISFQIKSSYKNINELSKGQYLNNYKLQNLIKKIVRFYNKNENKKETNKNKRFNYFKYFTNKIKKNKFHFNSVKLKDKDNKNNIFEKLSFDCEMKNNKDIRNQNKEKSNFQNIDKNIPNNNIINKSIYKNRNKTKNIFSKENYIRESGDFNNKKSSDFVNSINKNKELLSDSNIFNISNEPFNKNNINYEHIPTFKKINEGTDNNSKSNKNIKKSKLEENKYSNKLIENNSGNNIHEVNLNYVNNFCCIY